MEDIKLAKLSELVKALNVLYPPLDDCMWMNERGYEALKERCIIVQRNADDYSIIDDVSFAGTKVFRDDTVADFVVESGTMEHGEKIVKHTYWIGPPKERIEWPKLIKLQF